MRKTSSDTPLFENTGFGLSQFYPSLAKYTIPYGALAGSALGAGHGVLTGSKSLTRSALRGGFMGAGAGAAAPAAGLIGGGIPQDFGEGSSPAVVAGGLTGATAGGIGGGMLGNKLYDVLERDYDARQKAKAKKMRQTVKRAGIENDNEKQSAPFGRYPGAPIGGTALVGAGIGGVIGGLTAPKGKALRRLLGGATVGGLGGAGLAMGSNAAHSVLDEFDEDRNAYASRAIFPSLAGYGGLALGGALGKKLYDDFGDGDPKPQTHKDDNSNKEKKPMKKKADVGGREGLVTPGAMHNTIKEILPWAMPRAAAIGAAGGGVFNALTGRGALRGALRGGLVGAGVGAGAPLGAGLGVGLTEDTGLADAMFGGPVKTEGTSFSEGMGNVIGRGAQHSMTTVPVGGVAGGVAGGMAGNKLYNFLERAYDNRKDIAEAYHKEHKKDKPIKKTEKKSSARNFGEKVAEGMNWQNIAQTGLGGAAIGAGLGGLAGLVAPGEDEEGNRKSRLGAALRGALGGGLVGGGIGAAGEAFSPGLGNKAYGYGAGLYNTLFGGGGAKPRKPVLAPMQGQTVDEYQRMLNNNMFYDGSTVNLPNAVSGNYLPDYGVTGGRVGPPQAAR